MRTAPAFEFPPEELALWRKARRLEVVTIVFLLCAATLLFFTMGSSQAMRTGFFDDLMSTIPALAFLVCGRIALRRPGPHYPYGFHGAVSIGYLVAALTLASVGSLLLFEAVMKFVHGERTTIGGMELFGQVIWAGWPMIGALIVTSVPAVLLGRAKHRLAPKIHDKILFADSDMMKADWMVGFATVAGVAGVGFGFWWADPLAAALVSLDIVADGVRNLRVAVADLIERQPMKTDRSGFETLPARLRGELRRLDWVEDAEVRLRESGHVFFGEVFLKPRPGTRNLPERTLEAMAAAGELDWRLHDVTVTVLPEL